MEQRERRPNGVEVRVWEEIVEIPTYGTGKPDKNPMFLEKRAYQGSSGRVYPLPVIDKIEDDKRLQPYRIVFLENEYLHIEIMPELGGRVYRALDKTNQYDFVYYNRVIKPALVGLLGPWISGGIEFNWPQHHRPNTFGAVEYSIEYGEDGSKTVWVSEIDRMYGTKGMAGFTLYPGKAYLEIRGQLFNRTALPQTFLWWANPAFAVNEQTVSIFPPDVTAVFDHGKRDVSSFPIATGTYYKVDYSAGVDISRYKNIPVPTSYMVHKSKYHFFGGYDYGKQAGILHVADAHISPGKKQWTWGNGDFGHAWDRNLTDEDGPYVELMAGVFTDNQPDFSWLNPNEEKTFKQYFMPYKAIGAVKNATIDAAVNFELDAAADGVAHVQVYATSLFEHAVIEIDRNSDVLFSQTVTLSPTELFEVSVSVPSHVPTHDLRVTVRSEEGRLLVSYQPEKSIVEELPAAAKAIPAPQDLPSNEALYLAGMHLEQYRHATRDADAYYVEGLTRDSGDIRLNRAYGTLLLRRGLYAEAERHFRQAIATMTRHNPNPYDSEVYYNLGCTLKWQGRLDEAFDVFYKSIWNAAYQDSGYLALARISCEKKDYTTALGFVENSIMRNYRSPVARNLKTAILRRSGQKERAEHCALETISLDPVDFSARYELALLYADAGNDEQAEQSWAEYDRLTRGNVHNVLAVTQDYADAGLYDDAIAVLLRMVPTADHDAYPMMLYSLGYLYDKLDKYSEANQYYRAGRHANPDYCFPNSLWDFVVLTRVLELFPDDDKAHYYLGNWLYDKKRAEDAILHWEESASLHAGFPSVHRNLALAYANKRHQLERALLALEQAFRLNEQDARVFYEFDQLCKKLSHPHEERLARLERHLELVEQRDDLFIEYVTLKNDVGSYKEALNLLLARRFHPWEGGEGKVTTQYVYALLELGKQSLGKHRYEEAIHYLERARSFPENLGEGKLYGAQENHIEYFLGCAYEAMGKTSEAIKAFNRASVGMSEPIGAMFYNDQPPDTIFYQGLALLRLQNEEEAKSRFVTLIEYGEQHMHDDQKIDFFAVSLPDFLLFDDDLDKRNQVHCRYMIGLGSFGLGQTARAEIELTEALKLDVNHQGVATTLRLMEWFVQSGSDAVSVNKS